jgi:hypothetical protein
MRIYTRALRGGRERPVTAVGLLGWLPDWAPSGGTILFSSNLFGTRPNGAIYTVGTWGGSARRLTHPRFPTEDWAALVRSRWASDRVHVRPWSCGPLLHGNRSVHDGVERVAHPPHTAGRLDPVSGLGPVGYRPAPGRECGPIELRSAGYDRPPASVLRVRGRPARRAGVPLLGRFDRPHRTAASRRWLSHAPGTIRTCAGQRSIPLAPDAPERAVSGQGRGASSTAFNGYVLVASDGAASCTKRTHLATER